MAKIKLSNYYLPTRKEEPREAEIISHKLMVRAGMIRSLSRGVYSFLPLANRVQRKIDNIVREEMNRAGGMEVELPIMQPRSLWEETGRWDVYGPEMMRFQDRHENEFGLGPTHEEVITDLVKDEVDSYRDCPLLFYQIATKFRDEIRPRFGIMRCREFAMKDAYSFDADEAGAKESYDRMETAYRRIFDRIGFDYRQVEAATGAIGGSRSHEFMVLAENGEDSILRCDNCGYAANQEKAAGKFVRGSEESETTGEEPEKFATPDVETIEDLLEIDAGATPERQIKTMVMRLRGKPTALLLPGNYQLNETKVESASDGEIEEMTPGEIESAFGARPGSLGAVNLEPVNSEVQVWADPALQGGTDMFTGANESGYHYRNVDVSRDIEVDRWVQLRLSESGELCPGCEEQTLKQQAGIEVGHIFYLGTKYSEALNAEVRLESGKKQPLIMGCYGIGTSRIMAAAIEQSHDEQGIIWPSSIAPFDVYLLPINWDNDEQRETALEFADELEQLGCDVLIDDRDASAGVKFNDSELIGIPLRITLGRSLDDGRVELTRRASQETEEIPVDNCLREIKEILNLND